MNKKWYLICLIPALGILTSCGKPPEASVKEPSLVFQEKPSLRVETASLELKDLYLQQNYFGEITPFEEILVQPQITNQKIIKVFYKEFDFVQKGALLAKIDDTSLKLDKDQLLAQKDKLKAQNSLATINYEKAKSLFENKSISELDYRQYRTNVETSRADLKALEAQLATLDFKINQTNILAPSSGHILFSDFKEGSLSVSSNQFRILKDNKIYIKLAKSPEDSFLDENAKIDIPGFGDNLKIAKTSLEVQEDTKKAYVYIESKLKSPFVIGQTLTATGSKSMPNRPAIGVKSVFYENNKAFVYKVENKKVVKQEVETGLKSNDYIEIKSGLKESDKVVSQYSALLSSGDVVEITSHKESLK